MGKNDLLGGDMKYYCNHCDPRNFTVYGFCKNCKRRCECPLFDPRSGMSLTDYAGYKQRWNDEKPDLMLDIMRKRER